MFITILIVQIIPNVIGELLIKRKKIINKATRKNQATGKGSSWAFKKRQTLSRITRNVFSDLKSDVPRWTKAFGSIQPNHVIYICKQMKWKDIRCHKLSKLNRFLIWLRRLRTACTHAQNGILFGISTSSAQLIFENITMIFLNCFGDSVQLSDPRKKEILQQILFLVE